MRGCSGHLLPGGTDAGTWAEGLIRDAVSAAEVAAPNGQPSSRRRPAPLPGSPGIPQRPQQGVGAGPPEEDGPGQPAEEGVGSGAGGGERGK